MSLFICPSVCLSIHSYLSVQSIDPYIHSFVVALSIRCFCLFFCSFIHFFYSCVVHTCIICQFPVYLFVSQMISEQLTFFLVYFLFLLVFFLMFTCIMHYSHGTMAHTFLLMALTLVHTSLPVMLFPCN